MKTEKVRLYAIWYEKNMPVVKSVLGLKQGDKLYVSVTRPAWARYITDWFVSATAAAKHEAAEIRKGHAREVEEQKNEKKLLAALAAVK